MPMQENILAGEMLAAMGGKVTPQRLAAFTSLARAIIRHIEMNLNVTSVGITPTVGSPITVQSTVVL